MNRNNRNRRVQRRVVLGIGYPLLIAAAICTMIPLLWLLSSSFKTADEIFAVPIQWFPQLPPRVAASPYIVQDAYPQIKKPETVDAETWKTLQSELERTIWAGVQGHIAANPRLSNYAISAELKTNLCACAIAIFTTAQLN